MQKNYIIMIKILQKHLQGNIKYITFVSVKETNTKTDNNNESTSW